MLQVADVVTIPSEKPEESSTDIKSTEQVESFVAKKKEERLAYQPVQESAGNKEALSLWYRVTLNNVNNTPYDLSNRQMALLLTLNAEERMHTVRSLAAHLQISKPAVCRALDTLSKYDLATRIVDQNDRRNVFIFLTENGYSFLRNLSGSIMNCLAEIE